MVQAGQLLFGIVGVWQRRLGLSPAGQAKPAPEGTIARMMHMRQKP
jgi:hypothetical protein